MARTAHFSPRLFAYLRDLAKHNDRDWFAAHKQRYLDDVRDPMLRFIDDFGPSLAKISKAFVVDARPSGGSLFRIQRDTRFSNDKRPYKTNVGAQFRHRAGKDVHAPGFYLHLEPGEVFVGAGVYHPDGPALAAIRDALVADAAGWKRLTGGKAFTATLALGGDRLKRPPRGYDPEHPLIEDLKRKDYFAHRSFTEQQACAPGFIDEVAAAYRACGPLVKFLCQALGQDF